MRLVQLVAGYFLYVQDTFDVTCDVATRKHDNEVEWFCAKRETPFQLPFLWRKKL